MLTLKLKLKENINITNYLEQYSKCFRNIYMNSELILDKDFHDILISRYPLLDSWFIQSCKINVETKRKQTITSIKNKEKKIKELQKELTTCESKKKYKIINKIAFLKRSMKHEIVFGGKDLLRKISKEKDLEKKEILIKEFKEKRLLPICSIGEAPKNSNRKFGFKLLHENKIIFKPNVKTKINLEFHYGKNQKNILNKLQNLIGEIPITCSLDNKFVYISYDEEKLNNFEFNEKDYKKELNKEFSKLNYTKEEKSFVAKKIKQKWYKEQESRKSKGKISNRYASVDLNPQYIGFCIKEENKVIYKIAFDLSKLSNKLKASSSDKKQKYQNNKRKYELTIVWKEIFKLCKHYKVANFVLEELEFKQKGINENGQEFNRKCKNIWHRKLTTNLISKYCNSLGINKIEVNPCFSSFIGNLTYNDFDPIASSLELCRKGQTKYIKNNKKQFGDLESINLKKVNYLLGENVSNKKINNVKTLFKMFSGVKYRNARNSSEEIKLRSHKSKLYCII